jgi:hypothetical protein
MLEQWFLIRDRKPLARRRQRAVRQRTRPCPFPPATDALILMSNTITDIRLGLEGAAGRVAAPRSHAAHKTPSRSHAARKSAPRALREKDEGKPARRPATGERQRS